MRWIGEAGQWSKCEELMVVAYGDLVFMQRHLMRQAPKLVTFFVLTITCGKILINNLKKTGIKLVDQCSMCRCSRETLGHLSLHCDLAYSLLSYVLYACLGLNGWGQIEWLTYWLVREIGFLITLPLFGI